MNVKKLLLCALLANFGAMNAFFLEKDVFRHIEQYTSALGALEKYLDQITVIPLTSYNYHDHSYHATYHYLSWSDQAKNNLATYQEAEKLLSNKIIGNALGDGFLLGILAACCNKMAKGETLNKKVILPTIACAIAMIMYQNHKLGTVPYLDARLNKYDSQFENVSFYTVGRVLCALAAAGASYLGTNYALNKIGYGVQDLHTH